MNAQRGRLVVISGPSGSGKTSVCKALKRHPKVEFSVSATTRQSRPGEQDGVDYHFLAAAEFEARVARGEFVEWARYNGRCYGTLRAPMNRALEQGRIFVLEIEVQGTRQLRACAVEGLYLFIVPPDFAELRRRLERRGSDSPAEIEQRLRIAEEELRGAHLYDHVIENRDLQATIRRVEELIGL